MNEESVFHKTYDLCIVGSGPAGIILALEYSRQNPEHQVLLLEYGNLLPLKENNLDNTIHLNNRLNHHPPEECTNKGLGGTSASWGGRCVMFDEVDFMSRPIVGDGCTWDLALYRELKKYLQRTAEYFECGNANFSLHEYPQYSQKRIAEGFQEGPVLDSVLERWSMPTRFGKRYAKVLAARKNIQMLMNYEARSFSKPDELLNVGSLWVRRVGEKRLREVKASAFVLAAGAQESTRILLRNPHLFTTLGAPPFALGRFYQGHISGKIATVRFWGKAQKTDYGFIRDVDGTYMRRRFQFSTEYLLERNLLNTAIWLDNPLYFDPRHRSGAMSFMYLAMLMPVLGKRLAPPAIAHSVTKGKVNKIPSHLFNICKDFPGSLTTPAGIFYKRYMRDRKLPGVFLYSPENCYALHFHAEQQPDKNNRMQLGSDGETLEIFYSPTDDDIRSVILLHEALDRWLRKCGCGGLDFWYHKALMPDAIRQMTRDGIHQSGTTRIADTPEKGVVNRDLKLWGTHNVYVCSSSVFPTSGQANPTFMLGAFAVRLSEYLGSRAREKQKLRTTMLG